MEFDKVALEEKRKYEQIWEEIEEYRGNSPGDPLTLLFLKIFQSALEPGQRVIDFGCGSGRSSIPFTEARLRVDLVDLAANCLDLPIFLKTVAPFSTIRFFEGCLWDLPPSLSPAEWGVCFDVLEHIPTAMVERVLDQMAEKINRSALVSICLRPDRMGESLGLTLHLTIQPSSWWRQRIEKRFSIQQILYEDEDIFLIVIGRK